MCAPDGKGEKMKRQIEITDREAGILDNALTYIAAEYHNRAENLRKAAAMAASPEFRSDLEGMAHTWEMWAMDAEGLQGILWV